ncbi:MAG TPA: dephospho-CoA kinase [Acidimicrobiia bacterium]|nr:dephospho-CoA kinase [Acidimicrobiia bacterium]
MTTENRRWLLSGGIGSGKSEVGRLLAATGIRVVDADRMGHRVLEPSGRAFGAVADRWPEVLRDGVIDRGRLASIVFADPGQLRELEAVTHPHIFGTIRDELEGFEELAVVEVPIIDTGLVWPRMVVDAPDEIRFERALERGMNTDDLRARMASQPNRAQWLASADLVIPNHGALEELTETVAEVLHLVKGNAG